MHLFVYRFYFHFDNFYSFPKCFAIQHIPLLPTLRRLGDNKFKNNETQRYQKGRSISNTSF